MRYLGGRLAQSCLLAAGISLVSFILIHLAPGDPAALLYGTQASQQDIAAIRQSWGLDQPLAAAVPALGLELPARGFRPFTFGRASRERLDSGTPALDA